MAIFVPLDTSHEESDAPGSDPEPSGAPSRGGGAPPPPAVPDAPWSAPARPPARRPGGFTLLEVATSLLVAAVALSAVLPSLRRHADRAAARAARETVVGLAALARAEAMDAGGAILVVDGDADSVRVVAGGEVVGAFGAMAEHGVDLGPEGGPAELPFDALGLGRAASRTITLRRGSAGYSLTVSAYGRVKRW